MNVVARYAFHCLQSIIKPTLKSTWNSLITSPTPYRVEMGMTILAEWFQPHRDLYISEHLEMFAEMVKYKKISLMI